MAFTTFENLDVDITDGHRVLGAVIGTKEQSLEFPSEKLIKYTTLFQNLQIHSRKSRQNVYKAWTNAVQQKLMFISRTTPNSSTFLVESKKIIYGSLIPSMINHPRMTISIAKSLRFRYAKEDSTFPYRMIMRKNTNAQDHFALQWALYRLRTKTSKSNSANQSRQKTLRDKKFDMPSDDDSFSINLAKEKGASCWLNALPLTVSIWLN